MRVEGQVTEKPGAADIIVPSMGLNVQPDQGKGNGNEEYGDEGA